MWSMIHSARPTVQPVAIIILTWKLFCFARFWNGISDGQHVRLRRSWLLPAMTEVRPRGSTIIPSEILTGRLCNIMHILLITIYSMLNGENDFLKMTSILIKIFYLSFYVSSRILIHCSEHIWLSSTYLPNR